MIEPFLGERRTAMRDFTTFTVLSDDPAEQPEGLVRAKPPAELRKELRCCLFV
jgi:hypothetical protein